MNRCASTLRATETLRFDNVYVRFVKFARYFASSCSTSKFEVRFVRARDTI